MNIFVYLLVSYCLSWSQVTILVAGSVLFDRTVCWRIMSRATALISSVTKLEWERNPM